MIHSLRPYWFVSVLLFATVAGCKEQDAARPAARAGPVTALVAASTRDAAEEIAGQFTRDTNIEVRVSAGGSNTLATQILNGAPADVFLSASAEWAEAVRAKGLAAEVRPLLGNALVLIVPAAPRPAAAAPLRESADLLAGSVRHVALGGENVPAGVYGRQALTALKLYDPLTAAGKIVRGQDVPATLAYVERGEADAGIVYATDAMISKGVKVVYTFDATTYDPIVYPWVLLKSSGDGAANGAGAATGTNEANTPARRFYDYVASDREAEVFRNHGFSVTKH